MSSISFSIYVAFVFKRDLEPKLHPCFLWNNFDDFTEREPCAKFWSLLISSHEIMKLQKFEYWVSNVRPANVQNISLLVSFHSFVTFMVKEPFTQIDSEFDHFS